LHRSKEQTYCHKVCVEWWTVSWQIRNLPRSYLVSRDPIIRAGSVRFSVQLRKSGSLSRIELQRETKKQIVLREHLAVNGNVQLVPKMEQELAANHTANLT